MTDVLERLKAALADRYKLERELGSGVQFRSRSVLHQVEGMRADQDRENTYAGG